MSTSISTIKNIRKASFFVIFLAVFAGVFGLRVQDRVLTEKDPVLAVSAVSDFFKIPQAEAATEVTRGVMPYLKMFEVRLQTDNGSYSRIIS